MKTLRIDTSMLRTVSKCSTKTVLQILKRTSLRPSGNLEVGTLFHQQLANYIQGTEPEMCLTLFQREYDALKGTVFTPQLLEEKPRFELDNLRTILRQWLRLHPRDGFPFTLDDPRYVECPFELPLGLVQSGGEDYQVVLTGQLDGLVRDGDQLYVLEHKTTGRISPEWKDQFKRDPQNCAYQWAAAETTGQEIVGSYLNAIEVSQVPNSEDRECPTHYYSDLSIPYDDRINPHTYAKRNGGGFKRDDDNHPVYKECGYLHTKSEMFYVARGPEMIEEWKKDALYLAKRYIELSAYAAEGPTGATKTRQQGRWNDACLFCEFKAWCDLSRPVNRLETMTALNTQVREVTVGLSEAA